MSNNHRSSVSRSHDLPPVSVNRGHGRFFMHCALLACLLCWGVTSVSARILIPRVTEVQLQSVGALDPTTNRASIVLTIKGDGFGNNVAEVVVKLIDKETGEVFAATVASIVDDLAVAKASVPVATYRVIMAVKGADVETASDFEVELQEDSERPTAKAATPFEITFETFKSEQYPNLYSLLITNKSEGAGFSSDSNLMKVDIVPAGSTNVTIQPGSNPRNMMVTFIAPEKFEVKGLLITVYHQNMPVRFATPFKEKPPKSDPNQPKINAIDILSLQRRNGIGRLKIEGSGFGDHERPPIAGERELLCCLNRPQHAFERDRSKNPDEKTDGEVCSLISSRCREMAMWRDRIEKRVNVTLVPRNPDLRVERTQIMYIDDKVIDVYFEFTHYPGYSQPFRLQSATVTVNKIAVKSSEPVKMPKAEAAHAKAAAPIKGLVRSPQTFVVSHDVGLKRDQNLEYRYTILKQKDANRLFGSGVGEHFYVIELSVVNNAEKKVAIPLSAIQAEIEWAYGEDEGNADVYYEEGPATLSPMPLGAISGYFDAFQKTQGRKAKLFNIMDGMVTLGAALVPVFGNNISKPVTIFSGGFIPGVRKALGDLSSQQLQNLTSMSWESVEEIPAGAGKNKFIYIQRGDQFFGNEGGTAELTQVKKKIMNIRGLEVAGFEVLESEKKLATPIP